MDETRPFIIPVATNVAIINVSRVPLCSWYTKPIAATKDEMTVIVNSWVPTPNNTENVNECCGGLKTSLLSCFHPWLINSFSSYVGIWLASPYLKISRLRLILKIRPTIPVKEQAISSEPNTDHDYVASAEGELNWSHLEPMDFSLFIWYSTP